MAARLRRRQDLPDDGVVAAHASVVGARVAGALDSEPLAGDNLLAGALLHLRFPLPFGGVHLDEVRDDGDIKIPGGGGVGGRGEEELWDRGGEELWGKDRGDGGQGGEGSLGGGEDRGREGRS